MSSEDNDKILRDLITNDVEEGDFETRKIQSLGRVDIPDEFWEFVGLEHGEQVAVVVGENSITIVEKDLSIIEDIV